MQQDSNLRPSFCEGSDGFTTGIQEPGNGRNRRTTAWVGVGLNHSRTCPAYPKYPISSPLARRAWEQANTVFGSICSRRNGLLHHRLEQHPIKGKNNAREQAPTVFGSIFKGRSNGELHHEQTGGRGGIRTHGPRRAACFRGRCHRPLDHPSKNETVFLITRVLFQHHHSSEPQPGLIGRGLPRPVRVAGPCLKSSIAQSNRREPPADPGPARSFLDTHPWEPRWFGKTV